MHFLISYRRGLNLYTMKDKLKILIVEDEGIVAFDLKQTLEKLGYSVTSSASSGMEAIEKVDNDNPDIILMDIKLKSALDGIDTARIISLRHRIPIIYLTSYHNDDIRKRAKTTPAAAFLLKPYDEQKLKTTIEKVMSGFDEGANG
jgi:CheY-like chemotaxis protein